MHDIAQPMPGRYAAAIAVMEEMGWSWHDLSQAPHDLVEEILARRNADQRWTGERRKVDKAKAESKRSRSNRR